MDLNFVRSAVTLLAFASFVGLVIWAWSRARHASFDEAARLPFETAAADGDNATPEKAR